jgi:outer membrane biosynthesis protein TonB
MQTVLTFFNLTRRRLMVFLIVLVLALLPPPSAVETNPQANSPSQAQTKDRPNPDSSGRYHVGDGVSTPKVLYQTEPTFTKDARKQKVSGIALVNLTVDTEGHPTYVHILRSIADSLDKKHQDQKHVAAAQTLDQAAVDAVKQYKFEPALFQGKPVPVQLNVEVNFQIY